MLPVTYTIEAFRIFIYYDNIQVLGPTDINYQYQLKENSGLYLMSLFSHHHH